MEIVCEIEHAPLTEHDIEVQLLAESLVELQRVLIERRAFVPQIVRANDGGVASRVAAAEPALLQHGHVPDAVLLGEVVRRRQPVAAAADDHHVVLGFWLGAAPRERPVLVVAESISNKAEYRILAHRHDGYTGCRVHSSLTCALTRLIVSSLPRSSMMSHIQRVKSRTSSTSKPRVLIAGVPTRMPLVTKGD